MQVARRGSRGVQESTGPYTTYHGGMLRRLLIVLALVASLFPVAAGARPATASVRVFVEPGANATPILSLIRGARRSIHLEIYLLTERTIIAALGSAARRGVHVRVVLEQRPYGYGRYATTAYAALRGAGVPVRWANESRFTFTHTKSLEVDGRVAAILTLNLSGSGLFRNREFGVIDPNRTVARAITTIVDADWARVRPRYQAPSLVVSPYNARAAFAGIIDRARRTLDLYAEEVNDAGIENRLAAAVRRGVRVRLITSDSSAGVSALTRAGVKVHLMPSPFVHAKAIVADGARVFIGSENISTTSLDRNREIGIMLGASGARVVASTFAADWARSARGGGTGSGPEPTPPPPPPLPVPGKGDLRLAVSISPRTIRRGDALRITVTTRPNAVCSVRVTYPDGYVSRSSVLAAVHTAGPTGTTSWTYDVGSTVTGAATAAVSCRLGARVGAGAATFTITG